MSETDSTSTFEHRKRKFALIHDHLDGEGDGWDDGPRREENEDRLLALVMAGALPWRGTYHPEGYSETWGIHGEYFLQIFFSTGKNIIDDDLSAEEVRERIEEKRHVLEEGIGKPTATDGSKGQWKAANKHAIKSYRWFLGEYDGTEWMHDEGLSRAPEDWSPESA